MLYYTPLRRAARALGLLSAGVLSTLGILSLSHIGPASAQTPGVNLAALVAQVNALQSKLTTDETTIASQGNTIASQGKTISTQNSQIGVLQQDNAGFKTMLASLNKSVGSLQTLTKPLSLSGTDFTFTGVNVHIVDGTGSTSSTSGLGNLTIGYNATGNQLGNGDVRTGSHNLILGDRNNYSSFGGLITGANGAISGQYAVVSGGIDNTASGDFASVSGGQDNTASGEVAWVSGGASNTASGDFASVSGGASNKSSNSFASVSGGVSNAASGFFASVSGGNNNTASNNYASVSGGQNLTQNSQAGWSGGSYHTP